MAGKLGSWEAGKVIEWKPTEGGRGWRAELKVRRQKEACGAWISTGLLRIQKCPGEGKCGQAVSAGHRELKPRQQIMCVSRLVTEP